MESIDELKDMVRTKGRGVSVVVPESISALENRRIIILPDLDISSVNASLSSAASPSLTDAIDDYRQADQRERESNIRARVADRASNTVVYRKIRHTRHGLGEGGYDKPGDYLSNMQVEAAAFHVRHLTATSTIRYNKVWATQIVLSPHRPTRTRR